MQALLQWKSNKYYIFWVCVCSLGYPACNAHVDCLALNNFSTLSQKGTSFEKEKVVEHFVWNISHSTKNWGRYDQMYIGLHIKYPLFLSVFKELNFLGRFSKNTEIWNFMNIRVVEPSFFMRTDGQTDKTKLTVAFRSFANAPKVTEYERVILIRCRRNNKALMLGLGRYLDGVI
jgi:hypothetical protein